MTKIASALILTLLPLSSVFALDTHLVTVEFRFPNTAKNKHLSTLFSFHTNYAPTKVTRIYDLEIKATQETPQPSPLRLEQSFNILQVLKGQESCQFEKCLLMSGELKTPLKQNDSLRTTLNKFSKVVDFSPNSNAVSLGQIEATDLEGQKLPIELFVAFKKHEVYSSKNSNYSPTKESSLSLLSYTFNSFWMNSKDFDLAMKDYFETLDDSKFYEQAKKQDQIETISNLVKTRSLYTENVRPGTGEKELSDGFSYKFNAQMNDIRVPQKTFFGSKASFEPLLSEDLSKANFYLEIEHPVMHGLQAAYSQNSEPSYSSYSPPLLFNSQYELGIIAQINRPNFYAANSFPQLGNTQESLVRVDFIHYKVKETLPR